MEAKAAREEVGGREREIVEERVFFFIFRFFLFSLSFRIGPFKRKSVKNSKPSSPRNHALRQRGAGRRRQDHRRAHGAGMKRQRERQGEREGERERRRFFLCFFQCSHRSSLFFFLAATTSSAPRLAFISMPRCIFDRAFSQLTRGGDRISSRK